MSAQSNASSLTQGSNQGQLNARVVSGDQRWLRGLGALNWLQMPCPWGARGAGRGLGSVGPTDTAGPGGHCPSDPEPPAGENLQRKDLCDCSELRGQQGGRAGARAHVCVCVLGGQ